MLSLFYAVEAAILAGYVGGGGAIGPVDMVDVEGTTKHKTC